MGYDGVMPPTAAATADPMDAFTRVLRDEGVNAALRYLNGRVEHRCTAIYRLRDMTVANLYLYDRLGQLLPESLAVVPLGDSFCQHALRDGALRISDSRESDQVTGSPFKGVVIAYHGLPLVGRDGNLFGTLCHFDFEPRTLPDAEFDFLQKVVRLLPQHLERG